MATEKDIRIRQKVDLRNNFVNNNTKLLKNEIAIERDTRRVRLSVWDDNTDYNDTGILYDPGDEFITWSEGYCTYNNNHSPIDNFGLSGLKTHQNFIAFMRPDYITIEQSVDGGETWVDKEISDTNKVGLTMSEASTIYCGDFTGTNLTSDAPNNRHATTKDMLRITLDFTGGFYFVGRKLALKMSGLGNTPAYVDVEATTPGTTNTWQSIKKEMKLTGWPGWNILNAYMPVGISDWTCSKYRLTFYFKEDTSSSSIYTGAFEVQSLQMYGSIKYDYNSNLYYKYIYEPATHGQPYDRLADGTTNFHGDLVTYNQIRTNTINNVNKNTTPIQVVPPMNFQTSATINNKTIATVDQIPAIPDIPQASNDTPTFLSQDSYVGQSDKYARADHEHGTPSTIYTNKITLNQITAQDNTVEIDGLLRASGKVYSEGKEVAVKDDINTLNKEFEHIDAVNELFRFTNFQPSVLRICQPEDEYKMTSVTMNTTNYFTDFNTCSTFTIKNLAKEIGFPEEYKAYYKPITIYEISDPFNGFPPEIIEKELSVEEFFGEFDITIYGYTVFGYKNVQMALTAKKSAGDVLFHELPINLPSWFKPNSNTITQFPGTLRVNKIECDDLTKTIEKNTTQYFTITSTALSNVRTIQEEEARVIGLVPYNIAITEDTYFMFNRTLWRGDDTTYLTSGVVGGKINEWISVFANTTNRTELALKIDSTGKIWGHGQNVPEISINVACFNLINQAKNINITDYTPDFNIITAKENPTTCIFRNMNVNEPFYQINNLLQIYSVLPSQPLTIKLYITNTGTTSNLYTHYLSIVDSNRAIIKTSNSFNNIPQPGETLCYSFENVILKNDKAYSEAIAFAFSYNNTVNSSVYGTYNGTIANLKLTGIEIYQDLELNGSFMPNNEELLYIYLYSGNQQYNCLYFRYNTTNLPSAGTSNILKNEIK